MSVIIIKDDKGRMTKNIVPETGYWCELEYWPDGRWKRYNNSLGFEISWN